MMKCIFALTLLLLSAAHVKADNVLVLEGSYQNKNLFVSNSMSDDGVGFCAFEVRVNGDVTSDEINSSAFEIDLSQFQFNPGEKVVIQIKHKTGCAPKVLNPGGLQPLPEFEITQMDVSPEGMLEWSSQKEASELPYIVEQYKWNKWVKAGEVESKGTAGKYNYKFKVNLTSGSNKLRLVQRNMDGKMKMSSSVTVTSTEASVEMKQEKDIVKFSRPTAYEVYDAYGQIKKRGLDSQIDLSQLEKGDYYINFDNTNQKIRKK